MPKSVYERENLLNCPNSVLVYTWSLDLFIGFLMRLESAEDPEFFGIHDLLSKSLEILSFLSSKRDLFMNIRKLSSIPDFQGLGTISEL
jgi:hypothetical protein